MSTIYGDGVLLINDVPIAHTKGGEFVEVTHTDFGWPEMSHLVCGRTFTFDLQFDMDDATFDWCFTAAQVQRLHWKAFERELDRLLRGWWW